MRCKWSILIPTWNRFSYLDECITSVVNNFEDLSQTSISIRDNCSSVDGLNEVIERFSCDQLSCIVNKSNLGPWRNFNLGVSDSQGDYVHIVSDDDLVYKGFYKEIERLIAQYPEAGAYAVSYHTIDGSGRVINEKTLPDGIWLGQDAMSHMLNGNPLQIIGVVVKKDFYKQHGLFDTYLSYNADWDMWLRIADCQGIATSSKTLAAYRVHTNNDTSRQNSTTKALNNSLVFYRIITARYGHTASIDLRKFLTKFIRNQSFNLCRAGNSPSIIRLLPELYGALGFLRFISYAVWLLPVLLISKFKYE